MKSEESATPRVKTLPERFNAYCNATVQELDQLTRAGFAGISAVGSEDGRTAVILFAGTQTRGVFLRLLAKMEESDEYKAFIESLKQPEQ